MEYTIGQIAKATGVKVTTIRYYEKSGLMPAPSRTAGNTRYYDQAQLMRLAFIKHSRELGFNQAEIRELLSMVQQPDLSCEAVTRIANNHLDQVSRKIKRLQALKGELEHMIKACKGGDIGHCRIIEILADQSHAHCLAEEH